MPWTTIVISMSERHEITNGVVKCQPIRDVAARAVDVDRDRLAAVVGEFAQPFDRLPGRVFFDVADQIDVTKPIGLFFFDKLLDRVDDFIEQTVV